MHHISLKRGNQSRTTVSTNTHVLNEGRASTIHLNDCASKENTATSIPITTCMNAEEESGRRTRQHNSARQRLNNKTMCLENKKETSNGCSHALFACSVQLGTVSTNNTALVPSRESVSPLFWAQRCRVHFVDMRPNWMTLELRPPAP